MNPVRHFVTLMIEKCENLSLTRYARMAREEEKMSVRHLT